MQISKLHNRNLTIEDLVWKSYEYSGSGEGSCSKSIARCIFKWGVCELRYNASGALLFSMKSGFVVLIVANELKSMKPYFCWEKHIIGSDLGLKICLKYNFIT